MAVVINKISPEWAKVELNPAIDGSKELLINFKMNVTRVSLLDEPSMLDMVKVYMVDGEVLELHFSSDVTVDGTTATDNQHLIDLIETLFTS